MALRSYAVRAEAWEPGGTDPLASHRKSRLRQVSLTPSTYRLPTPFALRRAKTDRTADAACDTQHRCRGFTSQFLFPKCTGDFTTLSDSEEIEMIRRRFGIPQRGDLSSRNDLERIAD